MKYVDEFRDPEAARLLLDDITAAASDQPPRKFMEVCGGHTHAIYRHGIEALLPSSIELIHGPGCPVCVIPMGRVDDAIAVARTDGVTMCCFGDMLRVPGGKSTLLEAKARGADVRVVYSPLDALALAERAPDRQVVFLAVGFETTAPSTAVTLLQARERGVENFSVFCNHVTIVPAPEGHPGLARPRPRRLPRPRARVDGDRHPPLPVSSPSTTADRSSPPASNRWASSRPC